jgi:ribosomal protein S18 acetylase RimI-like enzyme
MFFRNATLSDVPALSALVELTYRSESSRESWTTEADLFTGTRTNEAEIAKLVSSPRSAVLVGELDGRVVACCHLADRDDHTYVGMFAVDPSLQARGVGRQVLSEAERVAVQDWDAREMRMTVITTRTALLDWYVRRGYTMTDDVHPMPAEHAASARPGIELSLVTLTKHIAVAECDTGDLPASK